MRHNPTSGRSGKLVTWWEDRGEGWKLMCKRYTTVHRCSGFGPTTLGNGTFLGLQKASKMMKIPTQVITAVPVLDPRSLEIPEKVTSSNFRAVDR